MLDPKEINKKAQEIDDELKTEISKKEKAEAKEKELQLKELRRATREGKKVREACRQFHKWAMKNKISPTWSARRCHWWKPQKKGWELVKYLSGTSPFYDTIMPIYSHLIVVYSSKFQLESGTTFAGSSLNPLPIKDNSKLGYFPMEEIKKSIANLVQQSGIPFN